MPRLIRPEFPGYSFADPCRFLLIEPFPHQAFHFGPECVTQVRFVHTIDLDTFNRVARIDVGAPRRVVADPREEDQTDSAVLATGGFDLSRGRDVFGKFLAHTVCQHLDGIRVERHVFQGADVPAESGAQPIVVDPRDLDRIDDSGRTLRQDLG